MSIHITADEIINEQKVVISNLQHELLLTGLTVRKLNAELETYQQADLEKNAAMEEKPLRRVSAAVETWPPQTPDESSTAP